MRVLLADDHPLFLDGLEDLLTSNGFEVAGTAHDGLEAIEKARELSGRDPDGYLHAAARRAGRRARDQGRTARDQDGHADHLGSG